MTLHLQLALIGATIVLIGLPVLAVDWMRERKERRRAFRLAQADKITVPVAPCNLYRSLERLKK
jgi:hypothetical protein